MSLKILVECFSWIICIENQVWSYFVPYLLLKSYIILKSKCHLSDWTMRLWKISLSSIGIQLTVRWCLLHTVGERSKPVNRKRLFEQLCQQVSQWIWVDISIMFQDVWISFLSLESVECWWLMALKYFIENIPLQNIMYTKSRKIIFSSFACSMYK